MDVGNRFAAVCGRRGWWCSAEADHRRAPRASRRLHLLRPALPVRGAAVAHSVAVSPPRSRAGGGLRRPPHAVVHAEPLRVNAAGAAALPVWLAWKPMLTEAFGARSTL